MKMQQMCGKIKVLKNAELTSREMFLEHAELKTLEKGEYLYCDKEKVSKFYFLISGYVSLYKISGRQEKKIVFICKEGEMLNEQIIQSGFAAVNAEALTACEVLAIEKSEMRRIMAQDYQLTEKIMKSMALKIRRLYHQAKTVTSQAHLDKEIAAQIWKLADRYGEKTPGGVQIGFDMSIFILAEMLDAKREAIAKQMAQLTEKRLVIADGRRFTVPDMKALRAYVQKEQ